MPRNFYTDRSRYILDEKLFYESANEISPLFIMTDFRGMNS